MLFRLRKPNQTVAVPFLLCLLTTLSTQVVASGQFGLVPISDQSVFPTSHESSSTLSPLLAAASPVADHNANHIVREFSLSEALAKRLPSSAELGQGLRRLFAPGEVSAHYVTERARFIAARKALARGDKATFDRLLAGLTHYPIYRYLVYEQLRQQLSEKPGPDSIKALEAFKSDYQDAVLSARLQRHLEGQLLKTEQWRLYLKVVGSGGKGSACGRVRAKHELGLLKTFDKETSELWSSAAKRPALCKEALLHLEKRSKPGIVALWARIYDAFDQNRPEIAEDLASKLATPDRIRVHRWIAALDGPGALLKSGKLSEDSVLNRKIVRDLVWRWSRQEPEAAVDYWRQVRDQYTFFKDNRYELDRNLGLRGAYRRLPEAAEWLNDFTVRADDLEIMEWRIRVALLAEDWASVLDRISELPTEEQEEDHWAYWVARAHESLGRKSDAVAIFKTLAPLQSYYGFLSADRLGLKYALRDEGIDAGKSVLTQLRQEPELIRAREYHYAQVSWEGRREWGHALDRFSLEEAGASAVIATEWGLVDRAIFSAGKAEKKRALSYRFPTLYESEVEQAAARNQLNPTLIYGVMRRESAFIKDIRSGAGAVGLMQLMPATAKDVARMSGKRNWSGDLTEAETNIDFGSFYLRHVLDRFDGNILLALASYNAGPHRVDKWLPTKKDSAPDLWVDTIPYSETRRYVRAVLAYSLIFDWRLNGEPERLSGRMPVVKKVDVETELSSTQTAL